MKIPKQVAKWTAIGSFAGFFFGPPVAQLYFLSKRLEVLENSPTYTGAVAIEKELAQYKLELAQCVPRNEHTSLPEDLDQKCRALANKYDTEKGKLEKLRKDLEYRTTVKKADTLQSHAEYATPLSIMLLIPLTMGIFAYSRRRREEILEKNPEYFKRLEELNKTIR